MPTAFIRKPFKSICVDTVLFFAMFVLVGHLTINYWERFTIQNELHSIKHSLYTLKDTVGNIGKAYDNLHTELKGLSYEIDRQEVDTPQCRHKQKLEARCKAVNNLDIKHRDFEVQTVKTILNQKYKLGVGVETEPEKMKLGIGVETEPKKNILGIGVETEPYNRDHKATGSLCKNASTNTRNYKTTGTTANELTNDKDSLHCNNDDNCRRICLGAR